MGAEPLWQAIDAERLLPGENPESRSMEDAEHWVSVYTELFRFKAELITYMRSGLSNLTPVGQREIKETDLVIMLAQGERLYMRLQFWKERLQAFAPQARQG